MKTWRFILIILLASASAYAGNPSRVPTPGNGMALSETQWEIARSQFENSVYELSEWLDSNREKRKELKAGIQELEKRATELRRETEKGSNVIGEIRLKRLLNDLKEKLQQDSGLMHQDNEKQREFEQKALSLILLYNEKIGRVLETGENNADAASADAKLKILSELIETRNKIQNLMKKHQIKETGGTQEPMAAWGSLKAKDRENLELALILLKDRKRETQEYLDKCLLEQEELKNELKLQSKMQEFLADIQRMNEDSEFPRQSPRRNDFGGNAGKKRLEKRLGELQGMIVKSQKTSAELEELMRRVQHQLDTISEGKKP
jgi:hypothetical protein